MPEIDSAIATRLGTLLGSTVYMALSSTEPTSAGGNITEPTIGTNGYARMSIATGEWTITGRQAATNVSKSFPNTPTGAWGGNSFPYFVFYTASTGGTVKLVGKFLAPVQVVTGAPVAFAVGDISHIERFVWA